MTLQQSCTGSRQILDMNNLSPKKLLRVRTSLTFFTTAKKGKSGGQKNNTNEKKEKENYKF